MELIRVSLTEHGMFGVLCDNGIPFAVTLEPDGEQYEYIPAGMYLCRRSRYHAGGYETFEIIAPPRTRLLFHRGNREADTRGCILVGEEFGMLDGKPAVLASSRGFAEFMSRLDDALEFDLAIVAPQP